MFDVESICSNRVAIRSRRVGGESSMTVGESGHSVAIKSMNTDKIRSANVFKGQAVTRAQTLVGKTMLEKHLLQKMRNKTRTEL